MTTDTALKAKVAGTIQANIDRMQAALATNKPGALVFAWRDYGLGVLANQDGISVVSIERASIVRKPGGATYRNGANVPAVLMPRDVALEAAIASARTTLAAFA